MIQHVFNRYEKKYLLNQEQYTKLREWLGPYMQEDEYGLHTIRNIYFDTESDELIRTSIEKPVYKEKFRVRCYGRPGEDSMVFLEIKKKYKGVVNKRRMQMCRKAARDYLERGICPKERTQIFEEIDYFVKRHQIKPKLYLAYERIALFGKEDSEFRITFDWNIRSRWEHLSLSDDTGTVPLLEEGFCLMEVKTVLTLPLWFVRMLSALQIQNTSFSKYGRIYQKKKQEQYQRKGAA